VRCLKFVSSQLNRNTLGKHLWTDSQCVLQWIESNKQLCTFVKNRVSEIKSLSENVKINYVPTSQNPADIATRGTTVSELKQNKLWWFGPNWLNQDVQSLPSFNRLKDTAQPEEASSDDKTHKASEPVLVTTKSEQQTSSPICLIDIERFSQLNRLLNVTVLVSTFYQKIKKGKYNWSRDFL